MNIDEIKLILENHKHWINEDCEGWRNMRANLREANLREADLRRADLRRADLREADLYRANLYRANLYGANLYRANLYGADLRGADLRGADLYGADLREADLYGADLRGAENIPYIPMYCPSEGSYIAFKKVRYGCLSDYSHYKEIIVKLLIPEDAKRSSAFTSKCRASKVKVLEFQELDGSPLSETEGAVAYSIYDHTFRYHLGDILEVNNFDEDRYKECAPGIHHFCGRQDAVEYVL